MVSKGFHYKWIGSKQITPKSEQKKTNELSDAQKESEAFSLTEEITEPVHFSFFTKDFKSLINSFKGNAALNIQRWYRNNKLKARNSKIKEKFLQILFNTLLEVIREVKIIHLILKTSAKKIQKYWRGKVKRNIYSRSLSLKKLLAQTVSVGSKLRRINSMIQNVSLNRTFSSRASQSALTPDKNKLSILYNKRSTLQLHKRTSSLPDILKEILNDESNLSNETIPDIPFMAFSGITEIIYEKQEIRSLLMKKQSFKVRPRRVKKMRFDELNNALSIDELNFFSTVEEKLNTKIPTLTQNSLFLHEIDFQKTKEKLEDTYKYLIKDL